MDIRAQQSPELDLPATQVPNQLPIQLNAMISPMVTVMFMGIMFKMMGNAMGGSSNSVIGNLAHSMKEELKADHDYRMRAVAARKVGDEASAKLWEHIAEEEVGHFEEFAARGQLVAANPIVRLPKPVKVLQLPMGRSLTLPNARYYSVQKDDKIFDSVKPYSDMNDAFVAAIARAKGEFRDGDEVNIYIYKAPPTNQDREPDNTFKYTVK
jgi:hypothetical protein